MLLPVVRECHKVSSFYTRVIFYESWTISVSTRDTHKRLIQHDKSLGQHRRSQYRIRRRYHQKHIVDTRSL